jgi:hypothetical protein
VKISKLRVIRVSLVLFYTLLCLASFVHTSYAAQDEINLSQISIVGGSPDVSGWDSTATITNIKLTPSIDIEFNKADGPNRWPDQTNLGVSDISPGDPIQYTIWMFRKINDKWFGAGFIRRYFGQAPGAGSLENTPCDWFYYTPEMQPGTPLHPGEQIGFMVTAGVERRGTFTNVRERSNVKLATVPANIPSPHCEKDPNNPNPGGGSDPGDSNVTAPNPESDGVTALPGKDPSLAFDPAKRLWLVVADDGGKIKGQFMTEKNKPSGAVLNIGGTDAHTPHIAYAPGINKYLVVWTSGKEPSGTLWGQLLSQDGTASGKAIKIATGGASLYANSAIQYDKSKQRFVLAYEKSAARVDIAVVSVDGSGTVAGPTELAKGVHGTASHPSLAINAKTGMYCATYRDSNKVMIQSLSPDGTAGTSSLLAEKAEQNTGIIYNATDGTYIAGWHRNGTIYYKTLSDCADNSDSEATLANQVQTGILVPGSNGFGLFTVNLAGTSDDFIIFDSSADKIKDQSIFAAKWNGGVFWLGAALNPVTGTFAAASSPNSEQVKFTANIGTEFTGPINNSGPIPASTDYPVPNKGLPTDLGKLIEAIFSWSLSIIGLVIFVRFFYAGILWFWSRGDTTSITQAKTIMWNAVYGAAVLFSAFLILNTINPDLVHSTFNLPGIPATNPAGGSTDTSAKKSCLTTSGSSYSSQLQNIEDQVLASQRGLATSLNSDTSTDAFIQALIKELKDNGYTAGRVSSCDSTGKIPLSIMIGFKDSDKDGEVCTIFAAAFNGDDGSPTIEATKQASCTQHADWKQLSP